MYYWYDFTVRGKRCRGSTKVINETRAQKAAALKLAAAIKGSELNQLGSHWPVTCPEPPLGGKRIATGGPMACRCN